MDSFCRTVYLTVVGVREFRSVRIIVLLISTYQATQHEFQDLDVLLYFPIGLRVVCRRRHTNKFGELTYTLKEFRFDLLSNA